MDSADFAQRLAQLKGREQRAQRDLEAAEASLAAERARVVSSAEAWQLVRGTAAVWERASAEEQQAMARALGAALGGFVVTKAGALLVGAPNRRHDEELTPSLLPSSVSFS